MYPPSQHRPPQRNNLYLILILPFVLVFIGLFIVLITQNQGEYGSDALPRQMYDQEPVQYNYGKLKQAYNAGKAALRKGQYRAAVAHFDVLISAPGHRLKIQRLSYIHKAEALCRIGSHQRMAAVLGAYYGIYKHKAHGGKGSWCLANRGKPKKRYKGPKIIKSPDYDLETSRLDHVMGEGDTIMP